MNDNQNDPNKAWVDRLIPEAPEWARAQIAYEMDRRDALVDVMWDGALLKAHESKSGLEEN